MIKYMADVEMGDISRFMAMLPYQAGNSNKLKSLKKVRVVDTKD